MVRISRFDDVAQSFASLICKTAFWERRLQPLNVCNINDCANRNLFEKLLKSQKFLINLFKRLLKVGPRLVLAVLEQNFQDQSFESKPLSRMNNVIANATLAGQQWPFRKLSNTFETFGTTNNQVVLTRQSNLINTTSSQIYKHIKN